MNTSKITSLFAFSLLTIQAVAQSTIIGQGFALDTLKGDKKVLVIQKLLPEGWQIRLSDKNFYIEHKEKVWFPSRNLLLDDAAKVLPYRYEYRQGKKILVVEMNPCFRFQLDAKWSQQKMADSVQYNDAIFQNEGFKRSKLRKVPSHMTEKYSLFLLAAYDFREYLPDYIYNQMLTLNKQLSQFWKIEYK